MKTNLILFVTILLGINTVKSQQIFNEIFSGTSLPTGWSISSTATIPAEKWTFYDTYDDIEVYESTTVSQNEWLYLPKVNLKSYSEAYFNLGLWFYNKDSWFTNKSCKATVHASTNDGISWTEIWNTDQITATDFLGEALFSRFWNIKLSAFCGPGKPDVKLAIQYTSNKLKSTTITSFAALLRANIAVQPLITFNKLSKESMTWYNAADFTGTYDIYYGPLGTTTGKDGGTLVTGLTGNTFTFPENFCQYTAFIRANKGGLGEWVKMDFLNSVSNILAAPDATSSALSWTGYSPTYDLEYGLGNFSVGTGTRINNINAISYNLTNLQPNTNYKVYIKASCNTANWGSKTFKTTALGTASAEKELFTFYPNPTKNSVHFSSPLNNIKILDISGEAVKSFMKSTTKIDITELPAGVYIISGIKNSGEKVKLKIIKG